MLAAVLARDENQSALLVGPRGTGKSLVLQVALQRVASRMAAAKEGGTSAASASAALATLGHGLPFVAVHINGYTIADDHSAVREISAQLAIDPEAATAAAEAEADAIAAADTEPAKPVVRKRGRRAAETRVKRRTVAHACVRSHRQTFEQHLAFVTATLRDGKLAGTPVVLVIDEFDVFCARTKQSLLYNLLDLTQDASVRFALVGLTTRLDVVDLLEKRLRSRFSHRQLLFSQPSREDYEALARAALALPSTSHILRACEALNRQALESTLPDVSPLEASLLGAMAHLETLGGDERSAPPYNFDMAFREYGRFTRAQGATTLPAHRDVALKAFERLVAHGLVVMTAVAPEAGEATRSAAHMSRHSQLLRLGLEPEVFVDAVRQGTLELPTALRHWIVHGEQT
ncbi:hypothetical protein FNF28_02489 [Cafeteria roenbergensis]|uniref:Uncharacterized protein n=1 Tax=Cafeteria roenbergensis TaxID=33653 RepID=A0A5A8DT17_CAFRO|nr:hypothetical protein FNF28_02489 [Cafeteria roenbergensis]